MFRCVQVLSVCGLMLAAFLMPAFAQGAFETSAKQAYLIDADTGAVLFEKNSQEKMPTSSMSKVMTMYLVFEALKKGTISLDDEFLVSEKAWRMGGSKMFVEVNKRVKISDLIQGVLVQSGNDATVVLAEGLAGTEDAFAAAINKKAQDLGMKNSHFMNASGWPDPDHYSTAEDLAIMARSYIHEFPEYYPYGAEKEFTYNNITQQNRNPLLYLNIGADGVKTGHTEDGGYGLIGSGKIGDRRVVMVLNGLPSSQARSQEGAKLLEYGLRSFENKTLVSKDQEVTNLPVVMGVATEVKAIVPEDVLVTLPVLHGGAVKMEVRYKTPLIAPIEKGADVGILSVTVPGQEGEILTPLIAGEAVAEKGLFAKAIAKIGYLIGGGQS